MFKFLMRHKRRYRVYYTLKGSSFVVSVDLEALSNYDANRIFDQQFPEDYERLPNVTEQIL